MAFRTIIAGSRGIRDYGIVANAIDFWLPWTPSVVLSGCAQGVDMLAIRWATDRSVPVERYPADWTTHGRRAGLVRNVVMAQSAEALLAIWDGVSPGTAHMIRTAKSHGLKVCVHLLAIQRRAA